MEIQFTILEVQPDSIGVKYFEAGKEDEAIFMTIRPPFMPATEEALFKEVSNHTPYNLFQQRLQAAAGTVPDFSHLVGTTQVVQPVVPMVAKEPADPTKVVAFKDQ